MSAPLRRIVALVAAVLAFVAIKKRPVRRPEPSGTWKPVSR
ncbi:MAG: hypothetical protein R3290_08325 [Acidimicrobiia bacterium]|nr:hypothetical protein [Acidimicrobiia bacterium]